MEILPNRSITIRYTRKVNDLKFDLNVITFYQTGKYLILIVLSHFLFLAFVSLFTLPKVYENNKQSIDTYLDLARSKVADVTEKYDSDINFFKLNKNNNMKNLICFVLESKQPFPLAIRSQLPPKQTRTSK